MFDKCPDFVRQLVEYLGRFFAALAHDHNADYAALAHDHPAYVDDQELTTALATKADDPHTHPEYINPDLSGYVTDAELTTALATKADAPPVNDARYYTETEINTLLSQKANVSHTHPEYTNKLINFIEYEFTGAFTSSGTSIQNVWSFTFNAPACQVYEVEFNLSPYQSNVGAAGNARFYINLSGVSQKKLAQIYHNQAGSFVHPLTVVGRWQDVAAGNRTITLQIEPLTGTWNVRDSTDRPASVIVRQYNY